MAEPHLDHPGDVSWWAGKGPVVLEGPCPHDCPHMDTHTVAWGPSFDRYELVDCLACGCRGWVTSRLLPAPVPFLRPAS